MAQDACKQPCIHDTYIRNDAIIQGAGGGHAHDGHITRNMRLCLYLTDILQVCL